MYMHMYVYMYMHVHAAGGRERIEGKLKRDGGRNRLLYCNTRYSYLRMLRRMAPSIPYYYKYVYTFISVLHTKTIKVH